MNLAFFVTSWPGRIVALALGVGVIFGAVTFVRGGQPQATAAPRTATVTRGSVTQTVSISGSVNAQGQARLAFKTGGRIANVMVSVGQSVSAGQALAQLDTTDLQASLTTAQQSLANAEANYQKQVLAGQDAQRSLAEAQRSTANDIATAQATLAKLRSNYATAKSNFTSVTNGAAADIASYRAAIDTMRTEIGVVETDIQVYIGGDTGSAKQSLFTADTALSNAQSYGTGTVANNITAYLSARAALLSAVAAFDRAVDAGDDTNSASANYQTLQINYSFSLTALTGSLDTLSGMVSSAQTAVSSAQASLNTTSSRGNPGLDQGRTDVATLANLFIASAQYPTSAKNRLTQAGTTISTITDAVNGSLVNAIAAVGTAQDRAASTLRAAQSAVTNIPFNLQTAQSSVDSATTAVANAQANLDASVLTAPSSGVVASIANQIGEYVSGGGTSNSAFIVLTNTNSLVLHGTIGEADVAKLKIGQVANITIDALSTSKMTGKVTSLDPVATISQGVPVYGVDIAIDVPSSSVKAGMSGTAAVILASKQNVLIVPNTAIRTVNGQRGLSVLKDGETVDTVAQFGLSNDTSTEVISGVAEGDVIVIPQARTGTATQRPGGGGFGGGGGGVIVGPGR